MNKRQKKKFAQKLQHKTYYGSRKAAIMASVDEMIKKYEKENGEGSAGHTMVRIIDNRKMNFKHVEKVEVILRSSPSSLMIQPIINIKGR